MALSSHRPSTKKTHKVIVAVFTARSVGEKSKRLAISDFIVNNDVDVLCITETWLLPSGDEAKCSDLSPPGYRTLSFPRRSRGGGIAFVVADLFVPFLSVITDFSFPHSSFELSQLTFSLPQCSLHIFCLYRPPPNRKNHLKDSFFMEQFPDLLEYNSLKGCSLIVGDFDFHYDVPTNTYTSRLIDLLDSFNLGQSVTTPTHRSGHILDWVIHRKDDDTLLSATISPTLQSDHCSVLTQLHIFKPPPHAVYIEARNIAAIDLSSFRPDLQAGLYSRTTPAEQLHRLLQNLLDQHAPATQRKVYSRPPLPWFCAVGPRPGSVPSACSFSRPSARGGERRDSG